MIFLKKTLTNEHIRFFSARATKNDNIVCRGVSSRRRASSGASEPSYVELSESSEHTITAADDNYHIRNNDDDDDDDDASRTSTTTTTTTTTTTAAATGDEERVRGKRPRKPSAKLVRAATGEDYLDAFSVSPKRKRGMWCCRCRLHDNSFSNYIQITVSKPKKVKPTVSRKSSVTSSPKPAKTPEEVQVSLLFCFYCH
jgi:hypothetical protein